MPQVARRFSIVSLCLSLTLSVVMVVLFGRLEHERVVNERNRQGVELFYLALNSVSIPIASVDEQGHILTWNKGAKGQFGWNQIEVMNKNLWSLMKNEAELKASNPFVDHQAIEWIRRRETVKCDLVMKKGTPKAVVVMLYEADHPPSRYLAVISPVETTKTAENRYKKELTARMLNLPPEIRGNAERRENPILNARNAN